MKILAAIACAALLAYPASGMTKGGGHSSSSSHASSHGSGHSSNSSTHTPHTKPTTHPHESRATPGVARDAHGKIDRSVKAKDDFKRSHPCPSTGRRSGACPGYVIDHVRPLKRGGADTPGNMQWQTTDAAKVKDRTE